MRRKILTKTIVAVLVIAGSLMTVSVGRADDTLNEVTTGISKNNERIYKSGQTSTTAPLGTITYPTVSKVVANNTRDGSITNRTTNVKMTLTGSFSTGSSGIVLPTPYYINTLNFISMTEKAATSGISNGNFTGTAGSDDWVVATGNVAGKTNTINMKTSGSNSFTAGLTMTYIGGRV
ncbi:hypothetical protein [Lactiplantibacillus herbarum]|uniref:hypothetical protein n=1 Tax=Lactiplantibacillus herbarum TaxID=1670446 RepID=UPI00064EA7F6|nr:hypothetical protein [Lactiplantibacillus herbarum]